MYTAVNIEVEIENTPCRFLVDIEPNAFGNHRIEKEHNPRYQDFLLRTVFINTLHAEKGINKHGQARCDSRILTLLEVDRKDVVN